MEGVGSCARSVVQKTKVVAKHRWVIEGFSTLPVQRLVSVTSPVFNAGGKNWELFCHNDGHSEQYAGCVSIFLQLVNAGAQGTVPCGFKFVLKHPVQSQTQFEH
jgi:hypothetical protein